MISLNKVIEDKTAGEGSAKEDDIDEIDHHVDYEDDGDQGDFTIKLPQALAIGRIYLNQQPMCHIKSNKKVECANEPHALPSLSCDLTIPAGGTPGGQRKEGKRSGSVGVEIFRFRVMEHQR